MRVRSMHLGAVEVHFHRDLTVLAGLDAASRSRWLEALASVLDGSRAGARYVFVDDVGQKIEVAHRIGGDVGISVVADGIGTTAEPIVLPTLAIAETIDATQRGGPHRTLATVVARARHSRELGAPVLVALDEPFGGLDTVTTWAGLDLLHRLSGQGQIVLLTDDIYVVAWARERVAEHEAGLMMITDPDLVR
jgi:hypothetical protein